MNNNPIQINILGSYSTRECFAGLNNINNAFDIDPILLYLSSDININVDGIFMPCKILIYLWQHLHKMENGGKKINLNLKNQLLDFATNSGLIEYINTNTVEKNKLLLDSVVLPFSKISSQKDFKEYIDKFKTRLPSKIKYDIITHLGELQYNSIEHGKTQDIYIMGQLYPKKSEIDITIYDSGLGMIKSNSDEYVKKLSQYFSTKDFYDDTLKKYGLKVFFIIMCVCTQFSTKGLNNGGYGLLELSRFLKENNGIIQIATERIFVELNFIKICDKIDIDSINIKTKEFNLPLSGTYISFTFTIN